MSLIVDPDNRDTLETFWQRRRTGLEWGPHNIIIYVVWGRISRCQAPPAWWQGINITSLAGSELYLITVWFMSIKSIILASAHDSYIYIHGGLMAE